MKESKEIESQQRTDPVIVLRSSSPSPKALISLEINSRLCSLLQTPALETAKDLKTRMNLSQ